MVPVALGCKKAAYAREPVSQVRPDGHGVAALADIGLRPKIVLSETLILDAEESFWHPDENERPPAPMPALLGDIR